jgi:peroxiredoxin
LFEAKTLDGKDISLIDYRGKFVLLSFWQPVSHPERQRLQELYDAYNPGGRLSIIGLGSNDTLEEVRTYVEENHIPWPQIFTGEESKSDIAKDYRIPGIPWIFLVAPDGKIIATGLRGEKLTSAVRSALEATNESKPDEQDQPKL